MTERTDLNRLWGAEKPSNEAKPELQAANDEYDTLPQQAHRNGYVPYFLLDRAERLKVVPVSEPSRHPLYSSLLDIIFDHEYQSAFTLVYSFMLVKVIGSNLGPIVHALNFGRCAAIHQFYANRFSGPPDQDKPLIESIHTVSAVDKTASVAPAQ